MTETPAPTTPGTAAPREYVARLDASGCIEPPSLRVSVIPTTSQIKQTGRQPTQPTAEATRARSLCDTRSGAKHNHFCKFYDDFRK